MRTPPSLSPEKNEEEKEEEKRGRENREEGGNALTFGNNEIDSNCILHVTAHVTLINDNYLILTNLSLIRLGTCLTIASKFSVENSFNTPLLQFKLLRSRYSCIKHFSPRAVLKKRTDTVKRRRK